MGLYREPKESIRPANQNTWWELRRQRSPPNLAAMFRNGPGTQEPAQIARPSWQLEEKKPVRYLLLVIAVAAGAVSGCASDSGTGWEEVKKDLRGDNMQMRSNFGTASDTGDMGGSLKPKHF
jgi:hypothetical protein